MTRSAVHYVTVFNDHPPVQDCRRRKRTLPTRTSRKRIRAERHLGELERRPSGDVSPPGRLDSSPAKNDNNNSDNVKDKKKTIEDDTSVEKRNERKKPNSDLELAKGGPRFFLPVRRGFINHLLSFMGVLLTRTKEKRWMDQCLSNRWAMERCDEVGVDGLYACCYSFRAEFYGCFFAPTGGKKRENIKQVGWYFPVPDFTTF